MDSNRNGGPSGIISLLTDFGTRDGYVAAMKGVILGLSPEARLVDVTHEITPQAVREAAFVLHTVHPYFPPRTVHLAVVDPGVGTDRAAVILDTGRALFVAPDNGLLSYLLADGTGRVDGEKVLPETSHPEPRTQNPELPVRVPDGCRAVRIAEPRYWLPNPSSTFHGRDIFAPVAAHLSLGEPLESFGPKIGSLLSFHLPQATRLSGGEVVGEVIYVDRFGNLITNLRAADLSQGDAVVEIAGRRIAGIGRTYAGAAGLAALIGSSGNLEIAVSNGSALAEIGRGTGTPVTVFTVK